MEDKLIQLLETYGFPVRLQGSFATDEQLPDKFFTFWNNYTESEAHYDNDLHALVYDYDVNYYSTDAEDVYTTLRDAVKLLKANGFTVADYGHSIASGDEEHDGRGISVNYKDYIKE